MFITIFWIFAVTSEKLSIYQLKDLENQIENFNTMGQFTLHRQFNYVPLVRHQTISTVENWLINSIKIVLTDDLKKNENTSDSHGSRRCQLEGSLLRIISSDGEECSEINPREQSLPPTFRTLKVALQNLFRNILLLVSSVWRYILTQSKIILT